MEAAPLTPQEITRLREMMDHDAIRQVVNDYFHAMDSRNLGLLEKVFTPDATYEVDLVDHPTIRLEGYEQVAGAIANVTMFRTSHHGVRNMSIDIQGDAAHVNLFAMDALHDDRRFEGDTVAGGRVIQHGLRYVDEFERRPEGWRIRHRHLYCLWQIVTINPAHCEHLPPW
jgi:ketosteroid isomerase-like protein